MRLPQMTSHTLLVLRALAAVPGREMYGLEIARASSLKAGTLYPLLSRLERAGWTEARDEDIDPRAEQRPRRRYYRITPAGAEAVREAVGREAERLAALGVTGAAPAPAVPEPVKKPDQAVKKTDQGGKRAMPCEHRVRPGSYCSRCKRLV